MFKNYPRLHDAAGSEGSAAGGGGGSAPAPAAAPTPGAAPTPTPAASGGGDNLFAAAAAKGAAAAPAAAPAPAAGTPAAPAPAAPAPADPNRPAWLPEQFKTPEDLAKSYTELKARMVDTGLPPKAPEEYKFELPATAKGLELDDAKMIEARKAFHGLGLTQKQFEGVMSAYFSNVESLAAYGAQLASAQTSAALGSLWKVPAGDVVNHPNMTAAMKALNSYGSEQQRAEFMSGVISVATVTDILAKVGREVGEDKTRIAGEVIAPETLNDLMKVGGPYWNPQHPDHERVKAQVAKHFAAQEAVNAAKRSA